MLTFQKKRVLEQIYCTNCGARLVGEIVLSKFDKYSGNPQKMTVRYGCPNRHNLDYFHGNMWTWTENCSKFNTDQSSFDLFIDIRDYYLASHRII